MAVNRSVQYQYIIAFFLSRLYKGILLLRIGGIEVSDRAVFVSLLGSYFLTVLLKSEIFAFGIFEERELLCLVIELVFGDHAVLNKDADVVKLLFVGLAVFLEEFGELVSHLLSDVVVDLLHITV